MSDNTRRTKLEQRLDEVEATITKLHDRIREARTLAAGENPVGDVIAFWVLSWKNAHGGTYEVTTQDAANLKRLVNQHGLEEARRPDASVPRRFEPVACAARASAENLRGTGQQLPMSYLSAVERETLRDLPRPANASIECWRFPDRCRAPLIEQL